MWVDLDDGWVGLGGDWIEIVPNGFGGYTAYEWGPFDDLGAGLVLLLCGGLVLGGMLMAGYAFFAAAACIAFGLLVSAVLGALLGPIAVGAVMRVVLWYAWGNLVAALGIIMTGEGDEKVLALFGWLGFAIVGLFLPLADWNEDLDGAPFVLNAILTVAMYAALIVTWFCVFTDDPRDGFELALRIMLLQLGLGILGGLVARAFGAAKAIGSRADNKSGNKRSEKGGDKGSDKGAWLAGAVVLVAAGYGLMLISSQVPMGFVVMLLGLAAITAFSPEALTRGKASPALMLVPFAVGFLLEQVALCVAFDAFALDFSGLVRGSMALLSMNPVAGALAGPATQVWLSFGALTELVLELLSRLLSFIAGEHLDLVEATYALEGPGRAIFDTFTSGVLALVLMPLAVSAGLALRRRLAKA